MYCFLKDNIVLYNSQCYVNKGDNIMATIQWMWMMNYCQEKRIPSAQSWAWKAAEKAYTLYRKTRSVTLAN